ncbi:MAG: AAA family ATPase [Bacillota bacterium]
MQATAQKIDDYLNHRFVERGSIVHGMMVSLVSRQHMLLIGPPGTAKSAILMELTSCISGLNYFQWLLTKFSTPEELFGPLSLKALEQGFYQRNTASKLPEAHIGFLDEIFKASSAILNSLLTMANERLFYNNGKPVQSPLMSLFGASNEYPEEDEGLEALYDRFLLRYEVSPVGEESAFMAMLKGQQAQKPQISLEEIVQLQQAADNVRITDDILELLLQIRRELSEEAIRPSDRRWQQSLPVIRAATAIRGGAQADPQDLDILKSVLWMEPGQRATAASIVTRHTVDQATKEIDELMAQAQDVSDKALQVRTSDAGLEAAQKLRAISDEIRALATRYPSKGQLILDCTNKVDGLKQNIMSTCLGI